MQKKHIIILGAGFGGLKAAFSISKELHRLRLLDTYEVILVDRNEHHAFVPLLYEVATTSKETTDIIHLHNLVTHPIAELIKSFPISFIQDEVTQVLPTEGSVYLKKQGKIQAEYMVLALGSEVNYFNIPGLKEYALTMKNFYDAIRIRDAVAELAAIEGPPARVLIGGGGATGVELAAELSSWCCRSQKDFRRPLSITILQAGPTMLSGLDSRIVHATETRLRGLGIVLKVNMKITKLSAKEVTFSDDSTMPYDLFIWSGGVKAPDLLFKLPLKTESRGIIETDSDMRCLPQTPDLQLSSMVYGIGDSICSFDPRTKRPVPAVAPAAIAQARVAAHNIIETIKEKEGMEKGVYDIYIPHEYPYVVPVGGKYAAAKIGPLILTGFLGWTFKGLIELYYLGSIMPKFMAFKIWLQGLWVFVQNDQLG